MEVKHCSGPWKATRSEKGFNIWAWNWGIIAVVEVGDAIDEGNANLIAAAPDLLAACVVAEHLITVDGTADESTVQALKMLRDAIAKAMEAQACLRLNQASDNPFAALD